MADAVVASGETASGLTVSSGNSLTVESAGTAISTTIDGGGVMVVSSGGVVSGFDVGSGGYAMILPGAEVASPAQGAGTVISSGVAAILSGSDATVYGALASGVTYGVGAEQFVLTGGLDSGSVFSAGAVQQVFAGGIDRASVISGGGVQEVSAGGVAEGDILAYGGWQVLSAGGSATDTTLDMGGSQFVYSGGTADGTIVGSGGFETISSGGMALDTTVESGGVLFAYSGAVLSGTDIAAGGSVILLPGAQSIGGSGKVIASGIAVVEANGAVSDYPSGVSGFVPVSGAQEFILPGGVDADGIVSGLVVQEIYSGGVVTQGRVAASGSQIISAGGVAIGITIAQGGLQMVSSAGAAIATIVSSGGTQTVHAHAEASGTIVRQGGSEIVAGSHAVASATTLSSGGAQTLLNNGSASDTVISQGGSQTVTSGGTAYATLVGSSGFEIVSNGGYAIGTTVSGGGILINSGGVVSSIDLAGGYLVELPGATMTGVAGSGTIISSGVALMQPGSIVTSGLSVTALAVSSGVQELLLPGGTDRSGTVQSGALQAVYSGGIAVQGVIASGGVEQVLAGGLASGMTVSGSFQLVSSGGITRSTFLEQGAVQDVFTSGVASDTTVDSGFVLVNAGGVASGIIVDSGGNDTVGGVVSGTTINAGGGETVLGGGLAQGSMIEGGGAYVFGLARDTLIGSGYEVVESGGAPSSSGGVPVAAGTAIGATVSSGATMLVDGGTLVVPGGVESDTLVLNGGVDIVFSGGTASGTTVTSGGTYIALPGALSFDVLSSVGATVVSTGVVLLSGETVTLAAATSGSAITSGMSAYVLSSGTETAATIGNHGYSEVEAGGTATNMVIGGGTLVIAAGGMAFGGILFSGPGGTLGIDASLSSTAIVSGFGAGDTIDFNAVAGGSATLLADNQLAVTNGQTTETVQLDPLQSFAGDTFATSTAATGGTAVTVTAATTTATPPAGTDPQPVDIPLYVIPYDGGYKIGIQVSLDNGATYKMDEFDTGGTGLWAAYSPSWWGSYSVVGPTPITATYASGNTYTGEKVSTGVTLQTTQGGTVSVGDADVGLITAAENSNGKFTAQQWNSDLTTTPSTPPLEGSFYGDFGMGLTNNNGLAAILPQLGNGLSNGFIISIGPYGSTGQTGEVQVGLTQADIASFTTTFPMQGKNTLDPFPNSGQPSYQEVLANGTLGLTNVQGNSFSSPTGLVFDTGAPTMEIHAGTSLTAADTAPYVNGVPSNVTLGAAAASPGGSDWSLSFASGTNSGQNAFSASAVNVVGDTAGYVNTGLIPFFGERIMYDVADGIIGIQMVACFAAGTRLKTPHGEIDVAALREGDDVVTLAGEVLPITWVGHRRVDCRRHPTPEDVLPLCIVADAFGPGLPHRDLVLSPDHALFLDDALIPVKYLLDGESIRRITVPSVTYYHIALARHEVVLAEGLAVETYLETGSRDAFDGGSVVQAHPQSGPRTAEHAMIWEAQGFAPLIVTGPALERAKMTLSLARQSRQGSDASPLPPPVAAHLR